MKKRFFETIVSLLFFTSVTLFIFRQLLKVSLKRNVIADLGDPLLNLYVLKHNIDRILSLNFNQFFDANIFYPYPLTLAFSENLLSSSVILIPIYLISKSIVATYNIFIILNFILSGFFMYLLSYRFTKNFIASIIAGTVFSFAPFKFSHLSHIHILTTMWIPLIFLFLHMFFESKKYRFIIISSLFLVVQSLGCGNYMVIISPFILIMFVFYFLKERRAIKEYFLGFIIFLIISGVFLIPVYYHYVLIEKLYGFKREIEECIYFSPNLLSFFTSWFETFSGKLLRKFIPHPTTAETTFYIGIIPLFSILLISLFTIKKNIIFFKFRKESYESATLYFPYLEKRNFLPPHFFIFYFIVAFISLILAFGPLFFKIKNLYNPLYYLFYHFFPGAKGIRAPSRFFIMFLFAASILISYFYSLYFRKRTLIIFGLIILSEFVPIYNVPSKMPYRGEMPKVYEWLKRMEDKFAIMELPLEDARWWDIPYGLDKGFFYTYFSAYHNKRLFNGYSGYFSPLFRYSKSLEFKKLIELAKTINIRYLIIHKDIYRDNSHVFTDEPNNIISLIENNFKGELVKVFEDDIALVYEILSRNVSFDPKSLYIKDYEFDIHFEKEDKRKGKLVFTYKGDIPCVLIYVNEIFLKFKSEGNLVARRKIIINPKEQSPFLLKGEKFEKVVKLGGLKAGEYLVEVEQDKKIIAKFKVIIED
ncbi:MAG: hypothetical protein ABDH49_07925 [Candidatus Hydrothermales bacterium]